MGNTTKRDILQVHRLDVCYYSASLLWFELKVLRRPGFFAVYPWDGMNFTFPLMGQATRFGQRQTPVVEYCCCLMSHPEQRGLSMFIFPQRQCCITNIQWLALEFKFWSVSEGLGGSSSAPMWVNSPLLIKENEISCLAGNGSCFSLS